MTNPWLAIPLADYEAHMALPSVAQAPLLADVFAGALARFRPRSVAVIGCAGGNGFERVAGTGVERLVGIDVNPGYVAVARERFAGRIAGLQLFAGDIQGDAFTCEPVDLAFAALLFEYVDASRTLERIHAMLRPDGVLVAVVQLAADAVPEVTPSPYASLSALAPVMRLLPPDRLGDLARAAGFAETSRRTLPTAGGKQLHEQVFTRSR